MTGPIKDKEKAISFEVKDRPVGLRVATKTGNVSSNIIAWKDMKLLNDQLFATKQDCSRIQIRNLRYAHHAAYHCLIRRNLWLFILCRSE